jgi:hypothetical protein
MTAPLGSMTVPVMRPVSAANAVVGWAERDAIVMALNKKNDNQNLWEARGRITHAVTLPNMKMKIIFNIFDRACQPGCEIGHSWL